VILTYISRRSKTRKAHFLTCGKDIMAYPQVRVNWTVEVNQPDPDIIEVLIPQSQNVLNEVLSAKKGKKKEGINIRR
jgi:hypothetical protein